MVCVRSLWFAALVSASLVSARADERRVRNAPVSTTLAKPWVFKRVINDYAVHPRQEDTALPDDPVATEPADPPVTEPVDPPATEPAVTEPVDVPATDVVDGPASTDVLIEEPTVTDGGDQPTATDIQGPSDTVVEQPSETVVQEASETDIPVDPTETDVVEPTGSQGLLPPPPSSSEVEQAASTQPEGPTLTGSQDQVQPTTADNEATVSSEVENVVTTAAAASTGDAAPSESSEGPSPSETEAESSSPPESNAPVSTDAPASTDVAASTDVPVSTDAPASTDAAASTDSPASSDSPASTDAQLSSSADNQASTATGSETESPDDTTASNGPTETNSNGPTETNSESDATTTDDSSPTTTNGDRDTTSTGDPESDSTSTDGGDEPTSTSGSSPSSTESSGPGTGNSGHADTGIVSVAADNGPESSIRTPPDVTNADQHVAEFQANLPETAITGKDAQEVVVMEAVMFDYFVSNDPAPVDDGDFTISSNVSNCKVEVEKRSLNGLLARELREGCKYVKSLEFDVHFNYIRNATDSDRPNNLEDRVVNSVSLLNGAYKPLGITFTYKSYQQWAPPDSGDNKDWSKITQFDERLQQWQTQTHTGNEMTVNVWLVNDLRSNDGDSELNGYAAFPWDKKGQQDGIVMREDRINKDDIPSFIHEMGHWLGLRHTFREQVTKSQDDCQSADGLLDSSITTGLVDQMYDCDQTTCDGKSKEINNYMSYSLCRGKNPANGFTTDQKSAIFSRVLKYRRGYRDGECTAQYTDPGNAVKVKKRSTMQDLVDGRCPNIDAAVEDLEAQPTATNAGVRLGYGSVYVLAALACSILVMM